MFLDWINLFKNGCLKMHNFQYISTKYNDRNMFFKNCKSCGYTEAFYEPGRLL